MFILIGKNWNCLTDRCISYNIISIMPLCSFELCLYVRLSVYMCVRVSVLYASFGGTGRLFSEIPNNYFAFQTQGNILKAKALLKLHFEVFDQRVFCNEYCV